MTTCYMSKMATVARSKFVSGNLNTKTNCTINRKKMSNLTGLILQGVAT